MTTIVIKDRTFGGGSSNEIDLQFEGEEITVKDLIMSRVKKEVDIYNTKAMGQYAGLVIPEKVEALLNRKDTSATKRTVDFEKQAYQALAGFLNSQFFVIINDKQVDDLEQRIAVKTIREVEFIKLTPLVGG